MHVLWWMRKCSTKVLEVEDALAGRSKMGRGLEELGMPCCGGVFVNAVNCSDEVSGWEASL